LLFALWGLGTHAMVRANVPRALEIGFRILSLAERTSDADMTLQGHRLQGLASLLSGNHSNAAIHYFEVLRRYHAPSHESHRFRYGGDPKALGLAQLAWSDWICGRIAESEKHALHGDALAREIGHPHTLVYAIGVDALRLLTARECDRAADAVAEARELAGKHGFSYWIAWCDIISAALECSVDPDRGIVLIGDAIEQYQHTGARQLIPFARAVEAECWINLGKYFEARVVIDEALSLVEETGVRLYQAELLRLRACAGYLLVEPSEGDLSASIELAERQGARSFVLRSILTKVDYTESAAIGAAERNKLTHLLFEMRDEPETVDMRAARKFLARIDA